MLLFLQNLILGISVTPFALALPQVGLAGTEQQQSTVKSVSISKLAMIETLAPNLISGPAIAFYETSQSLCFFIWKKRVLLWGLAMKLRECMAPSRHLMWQLLLQMRVLFFSPLLQLLKVTFPTQHTSFSILSLISRMASLYQAYNFLLFLFCYGL